MLVSFCHDGATMLASPVGDGATVGPGVMTGAVDGFGVTTGGAVVAVLPPQAATMIDRAAMTAHVVRTGFME